MGQETCGEKFAVNIRDERNGDYSYFILAMLNRPERSSRGNISGGNFSPRTCTPLADTHTLSLSHTHTRTQVYEYKTKTPCL